MMKASWLVRVAGISGLVVCACTSPNDNRPGIGGMPGTAGVTEAGGMVGGGGMTGAAGMTGGAGIAGAAGLGGSAGMAPPPSCQGDAPPPSCNYFSVDVIVSGATGRDRQKMQQVATVEVTAVGATSEAGQLALPGFPHPDSYSYQTVFGGQIILATFPYGTTAQSGTIAFTIVLKDGSLNTLAAGESEGTIQPGTAVRMAVTVDPASSW